ncbi:MAG TPA: hypothetical protein VGP31_07945 [Planosporangium sp.]|nr:hypothetical protein [Planosporangium sp.]
MDRDIAESLLRGDYHHARTPGALVHLLAAATAPARNSELAGEEPAVAAFRQPHRAPMHAPGRRTLLARLLTVKITAAFALTAAGGAALAAAGNLHKLPGASGFSPRPAAPTSAAPSTPAMTARSTGSPAVVAPPRRPSPSPTESGHPPLDNLCRILVADARNKSTGVHMGLDSSAFAALMAMAGGKASVWSYCIRLLTTDATAGPGAQYPPYGDPNRNRNYPTYPGYPGYPTYPGYPQPPQYPDQNQGGQNGQAAPQTADRDPSSPRPGSRSAQTSSLR